MKSLQCGRSGAWPVKLSGRTQYFHRPCLIIYVRFAFKADSADRRLKAVYTALDAFDTGVRSGNDQSAEGEVTVDMISQMNIFQLTVEADLGRAGVAQELAESLAATITDTLWRSDVCHPDCRELYEEVEAREAAAKRRILSRRIPQMDGA